MTAKLSLTLTAAAKPPVLSKSFTLAADGTLQKHPGGNLVAGHARTLHATLDQFMRGLAVFKPSQAFVYGICPHTTARIVPRGKLEAARKAAPKEAVIARDREHFSYPEGPGICMFDYDPAPGAEPLARDDLLQALYRVCPGLESHPHVWGASASSCIYASDGTALRGVVGQRVYVPVSDARDIPRFGDVLFKRLWLAGLGRFDISKSGALLERSVIDAAVWQPERLDFAGGAQCGPGLEQRRPAPLGFNIEAPYLDTWTLPDLSPEEVADLAKIKAAARQKLKPEMEVKREAWIDERVAEHEADPAKWREVFQAAAREKRLLGDFVLHPAEGGTVSVGTILDNSDKWHGQRFADPLEPDYGNDPRIAWLNLRAAGKPYLYSWAHGGQRYALHRALSTIKIQGGERPRIVTRLLELARLDGTLFDRGGELVRLADGQMYPVDGPWLETYLTGVSRFVKLDKRSEKWESRDCPKDLAQAILSSRGEWGLPLLDAIQRTPTIDPVTGRVLDTDGYDAERRLYLDLGDFSTWRGVPDRPSDSDVRDAITTLWFPFKDFPLPSPVDRGGLLAALLTAPCRGLLPKCPGFLVTAPAMGSGKTLLATSIAHLTGSDPEIFPPADTEDELRKRLATIVRHNTPAFIVDNICGTFESASLCMYLTSERFDDRLLGSNTKLTGRTNSLVFLTGNNPIIAGDMTRRLIRITIDTEMENPCSRTFEIDPDQYVRDHRLEMVRAALIVLRSAHTSGFRHDRGRLASFEIWSDFIRTAVLWIGQRGWLDVADPVDGIETSLANDPDREKLDTLLTVWAQEFGERGAVVADAIQHAKTGGAPNDLRNVLEAVAGFRGEINPRILASWIKQHERKIVNGSYFTRNGTWKKMTRWMVYSVYSVYSVYPSYSSPANCQNDTFIERGETTPPNTPCSACVNYSLDAHRCDFGCACDDDSDAKCRAFERVMH